MKTQSASISVVLPAYNEELVIEQTAMTVYDFLLNNFNNFEIIIVDDGSVDGTAKRISELS